MADARNALAAYGGAGWSPRTRAHVDELGDLWADCGTSSEHDPLEAVLLHRPGRELEASAEDPEAANMLAKVDPIRAAEQHDAVADAYRAAGVRVHYVEPDGLPPPNQLFVADLLFMTPEGAIVARPASLARAGEERWVARRLAALGIPILRTLRGHGTFEGADAAWLDERTVLIGEGFRTNSEGAHQVTETLTELGVAVHRTRLPKGSMHLMGLLRLVAPDLALASPKLLDGATCDLLEGKGYAIVEIDEREAIDGDALNLVVLEPRHILMPAGNPRTSALLQSHGVSCRCVETDAIHLAAGNIACMTGILKRGRMRLQHMGRDVGLRHSDHNVTAPHR